MPHDFGGVGHTVRKHVAGLQHVAFFDRNVPVGRDIMILAVYDDVEATLSRRANFLHAAFSLGMCRTVGIFLRHLHQGINSLEAADRLRTTDTAGVLRRKL